MNRSTRTGGTFALCTLTLGIVLVALGASGCSGDSPGAAPTNTVPTTVGSSPSASMSPTATATESATPTQDAWRAKFSAKELAAMDGAIAAWQAYGEAIQPFYAEPGSEAEVRKIFERYSMSPDLDTANYVRGTIDGGVRQVRSPVPLYIRGKSVELNPKGSLATFVQCTDYSSALVTQNGKKVNPGVTGDTAPITIQMSYSIKAPGRAPGWRVYTAKVVDKPCA